jgi:hypothetical protein
MSWSAPISQFLSPDLQFIHRVPFCSAFRLNATLIFFPPHLQNMNWLISIYLLYFGLHTTCKNLTMQPQGDLAATPPPPNWSAAINCNYLLRRLILFQPRFSGILLIFFWHLSELKMQIEHTNTHTHTHQWHNSWEKHQLLCIFFRNFRVIPRIVQYISVRISNSCFACIFILIVQ